jgi:hypothetical protein
VALLARRASGSASNAARIRWIRLHWVGAGEEMVVALIRINPVNELRPLLGAMIQHKIAYRKVNIIRTSLQAIFLTDLCDYFCGVISDQQGASHPAGF